MDERDPKTGDEKEVTPADVEAHRYTNPAADAEAGRIVSSENEEGEEADVEAHRHVNPRIINP